MAKRSAYSSIACQNGIINVNEKIERLTQVKTIEKDMY